MRAAPPTEAAPSSGDAADVLRQLDLSVNRRLDGLLHGDYRGLVPGHGSEPGDARIYQPGDDVRRIDWNVTARSQQTHVRETIADRELEARVVVDMTPSLDFGTALCEKRDLAIAATAAICHLTARLGNRVGVDIVTASGITGVPPRQGKTHVQGILRRLIDTPRGGSGRGELAPAIARMGSARNRRGLAVVISDFLASDGWAHELRKVNARHETLAIEIIDPRELELPDVGILAVVDPETGEHREVATSSGRLRRRYAAAAAEQRAGIAADLRWAGADHLILRTDRDWLLDMVQFVALRRDRTQSLARPHQ
jgi:uncharacterized protein (DUF58 family)